MLSLHHQAQSLDLKLAGKLLAARRVYDILGDTAEHRLKLLDASIPYAWPCPKPFR